MSATDQLDELFGALASAPRRDIVTALTEGPVTTPQLGERFGFSKQALNRHVRELERCGLVRRRLDGRVHTLALEPDRLAPLTEWASLIATAWEANLDRLGAVLDEASRSRSNPPPESSSS
ncbi:MAG: helix-turn-helix domain-containing protein [Actinomycetota bacterium]